jgi:WD40 repeat protein
LPTPDAIFIGGGGTDAGVLDAAFHPTQPWLFTSGADGSVTLWQPAKGGHAGFPSGPFPANVRAMPQAVTAFLDTHL